MTQNEIERLARQLMADHGFSHIPLRWSNGKRILGAVRFLRVTHQPIDLTLSKIMLPLLPEDQVRDVILHEIAHLMTPGEGHGPRWKAACRQIGAKPERTTTVPQEVKAATAKHTLVCQKCGHEVYIHRRLKYDASRYAHKGCGGRFKNQ